MVIFSIPPLIPKKRVCCLKNIKKSNIFTDILKVPYLLEKGIEQNQLYKKVKVVFFSLKCQVPMSTSPLQLSHSALLPRKIGELFLIFSLALARALKNQVDSGSR